MLLTIVLFWARTLLTYWPHLVGYPWQVAGGPLVLALAALVAQMLVLATAWHRALALVAAPIAWRDGASMWLRAQIARYMPGGLWDVVGRVVLSRPLAMPTRAVPAAAGLEIGLQVLSAGSVAVLALLAYPDVQARRYLPALLAALGLVLLSLTPPLFRRLIHLGLNLIGRPPLETRLTFTGLMRLYLLYVGAHLLQGLAFVLFARGIGGVAWGQAPRMLAAYIAAWLAGYVIVFAPGGIGVREAALVLLLGNTLPRPLAIALALGFRVWVSLRDGLAALIGLGLRR